MTDPPRAGLLTRYLFENPWPAGLLLAGAAVALLWLGWRDARLDRLKYGSAFAILAIAVFIIASLVTTAGEHGKRVTRQLVDHAVNGRVSAAMSLFTAGPPATPGATTNSGAATIHFGQPTNPGLDISTLQRGLQQLADRVTIQSHMITDLDGYRISSGEAEVHMTVLADAGFGMHTSRWILRITEDETGTWRITKITWLSLDGRTPDAGWLR